MHDKFKIGEIRYSNCTPIYSALKKHADCNAYEFVPGEPAALNAMLASGRIDASASSSIEYARRPGEYLAVPDISISSKGEVGSILLFSRKPVHALAGEDIALTSASATSTVLLKALFKFYYKIDVKYSVKEPALKGMMEGSAAALLIGDEALKERLALGEGSRLYVYDLGRVWQDFTGLPFVYALWMVRADSAGRAPELARRFRDDTLAAKRIAIGSLDEIADVAPEASWMGRDGLLSYWRGISYDLTGDHLRGLMKFFELAAGLGEARPCPAVKFL